MKNLRAVGLKSLRTLAALALAFMLAILAARCGAPNQRETTASPPPPETPAATPGSGVSAVYPLDPGPPDPLAERLCAALHALPASRKGECCATPPSSNLAGECVRVLTAALRDKAVAIKAEDVDRCAEASSRALEGCDWVTPLMPRTPDACRGIVVGLLQSGATCRSSLDCGDGLACRGATPTTTGVCAAPGKKGDACGAPADTLATYLRQTDYESRHQECDGFCRGGTCVDYLVAGSACSSSGQCGPGSHCVGGRCVKGALPAIGQPCRGDCAGDARCAGGKCVALKAAGESCTSPFECLASCVIPPGAKVGTCGRQCTSFPLTGSGTNP